MAAYTITAANVQRVSGQVGNGIAGAAITAGQAITPAADGDMEPADCDAASPLNEITGIALNSAAAGQPVRWLYTGVVTIGGAHTVGEMVYLAPTPGGIGPVADVLTADKICLVGIMVTASNLALKIWNTGVAVPA